MNKQQHYTDIATKAYDFSLLAVWREAWGKIHGHKLRVCAGGMIYVLFNLILFWVPFSAIFLFPLLVGVLMMGVHIAVDHKLSLGQLFSCYRYILHFLVIELGLAALFALGFFAVFLPIWLFELNIGFIPILIVFVWFVYITVCGLWAPLILVQKRLSIWHSFKLAFSLTRQHIFKVTLTLLLLFIPFSLILMGLLVNVVMLFNPTVFNPGATMNMTMNLIAAEYLILSVFAALSLAAVVYLFPLLIVGIGILYREIFGFKVPAPKPKVLMSTDVNSLGSESV